MRNSEKRKISTGTIVVLTAAILIIGVSFFVWTRLSSGKSVDLSHIKANAIELKENETIPEEAIAVPGKGDIIQPASLSVETEKPAVCTKRSFILTAGGTVALDGEVRKNSYYSDAKQYDYFDTMSLLKKEIQSDLNIVFLENLLSEDGRSSDLIATNAAAAMLKGAGFNLAACGFARAYEKEQAGIQSTRKLLNEHGIASVGIYESQEEGHYRILDINGIRTAILQYTGTISNANRKNMVKNNTSDLVPDAQEETIAADISEVRAKGCEVVVVLLNWGKNGKAPDKTMRALAQKTADAGADLIIGNGSRIVSGAELLKTSNSEKQVLCVWSLGTVLSGDRGNIKKMSGILLQVTVTIEGNSTEISNFRYIPLYTWKYKQDSRYYYRCLAADEVVPDGMDTEQQKMMKKASDTIRNAMKDSPVEERVID